MPTTREGVNPLRPYYIPPSIGDPPETPSIPGPNAFSNRTNATAGTGAAAAAAGGKYASAARDMFSDLDYKNYVPEAQSSGALQTIKDLLDELMWKYTSVLMAQPFEVAKLVLQVRMQDDIGGLGVGVVGDGTTGHTGKGKITVTRPLQDRRTSSYRSRDNGYGAFGGAQDSDSEGDEPAYFTSNVVGSPSLSSRRSYRGGSSSPPESPRIPSGNKPDQTTQYLNLLRPDSVTEVISQVWQREGAWGVWKGSNATFIYGVLQSLLENWSRSMLSALFDVPDLGLRDIDRVIELAAPYPWTSLGVAAIAAVVTGLVLAPLDLVRTRLIVTPTTRSPRKSFSMLRQLPSFLCSSSLILPTVLYSLVHPILSLTTPLVLRTKFMIDKEVSPTTFSIAKFCTSSVALFVKLPLETVLRRGQIAVLNQPAYLSRIQGSKAASPGEAHAATSTTMETIVPTGSYNGVVGTMQSIIYSEGSRSASTGKAKTSAAAKRQSRPVKIAESVYLRGQGVEGLWRGWKVGWWGLVGLWTAAVVGGGDGGEF